MMIIHCCLNTGLQIQGEFAFVCEPCVGTINKTESSLYGLFEGKVGQLFKKHFCYTCRISLDNLTANNKSNPLTNKRRKYRTCCHC